MAKEGEDAAGATGLHRWPRGLPL